MKSRRVRTFLACGVPYSNGCNPQLWDDEINEWLKNNPEIVIEEKILHTSTTSYPEPPLHQAVVTMCLMVVYRV
jgi:hypothetical protein